MIALLFVDGVLNWLQNIIAFSVLSLVTPLTYAVASASKRIFVIGVSLIILGNPVTWINCFGMTLAILGVLCYNRAKHYSNERTLLPVVAQNGNLKKYTTLRNQGSYHMNTSKPNGYTMGKKNSLLATGSGIVQNGSTTHVLFV